MPQSISGTIRTAPTPPGLSGYRGHGKSGADMDLTRVSPPSGGHDVRDLQRNVRRYDLIIMAGW